MMSNVGKDVLKHLLYQEVLADRKNQINYCYSKSLRQINL